ncbi:TonB-dependent receptor-like beta-barrel domain-containing protein [Sphingomonas zeae]
MRDSSVVTNPASSTAGAPGYDYFDLSASLRVSDRFELRGGVNNLTDKAPPIIGGTAGVTNNGVYYVVGRTLFLAFKARL